MNTLLRRILSYALYPFIALAAPLFYYVARSGNGVELCRRLGFHPLRIHYYEPVPDYESVPDAYFTTPQTFPGFSIDEDLIKRTLALMGNYARECQWPEAPPADGGYYAQNPSFGYSSAALLHTMIRAQGTRRVVEIGSGSSTRITLDALAANGAESHITCIEPYPPQGLKAALEAHSVRTDLIVDKAENVPLERYTALAAGDVLFIDSSHVAKLNSDVNFLYLQVLPRLGPGVIVHIHDMYIPYEYPRVHFYGKRKFFWNEQYMLLAFLACNPQFEVILPGYYVQKDMAQHFKQAFPGYDAARHRLTSSFWLRRAAE